ncbi:GD18586 [Drosophila simulans]|uniref:GD18586 n=1 Tax=Drosophila simulans TaxID=7240 RepID=B4QXB9_DROSI|nr:GD18586 [Drosophila simulans]
MNLLWALVIVAELKCHTGHTPPDYCNASICPANKRHITCGFKFVSTCMDDPSYQIYGAS